MSSKLFDSPFQGIILWYINSATCWTCEMWIFNIFWNGNEYVNIVGNTSFFIVTFNFNQKSDLSTWRLLNDYINRKQRLDSNVKSVTHKFKLPIWRNESYQSLILEFTQSDALMEFNIIKLNSLAFWCSSLSLIISLIIKTEFKIWHTWKLAVCVNNSNNLWLNNVIGWTNEHVELLNNIQEELVFTVFDSFRSPRNNICYLSGNTLRSWGLFRWKRIGQLIWLCFYIPF